MASEPGLEHALSDFGGMLPSGGVLVALGAAALAFAAQNGWHGLDAEAPAMIAELQEADTQ